MKTRNIGRSIRLAALSAVGGVLGLGLCNSAMAQPRKPTEVPDAARVEKVIRAELDKAVAKFSATPNRAVADEIESLFDIYVAYGLPEKDTGLLADLAAWRRLGLQAGDGKNPSGQKIAPFLVANPELSKGLVFMVRPEDDIPGVYALMAKMLEKHEKELADTRSGATEAGALAVAISVVYDKPPAHPVLAAQGDKAAPVAIDPMEVFEFFLASEPRLVVKSRQPRVWVNIVDVHCDMDDLRWAQQTYMGNQMVGKVYSSIVYDTGAFKFGREKKVFKDGYTLRNIKKVGGVCTEQAYFASEVAKAIGVPSVYVTGEGSDVGHAWVGYMKNAGSRMQWDFSEGRFGDYKTTQGRVIDPQTGRATTDAFAGLSELIASATKEKIWEAQGRTDAAARLIQKANREGRVGKPWPPAWPTGEGWGDMPKAGPREADIGPALVQLRAALTACAGYEPAWRLLMLWSEKGMLDGAAKKEWADAVIKMAARDRPDFAFAVLTPMIRSAEPAAEQCRLWDWAAGEFQKRPDLVSASRVAQGECWEKAGESARAWTSYKDVITKYPNDGRGILIALARAEALLLKEKKDSSVVGLYEDAFRRINKPAQMSPGFETASNYYLVGSRYVQVLDGAGRAADATRIRKQIGLDDAAKGGKGG